MDVGAILATTETDCSETLISLGFLLIFGVVLVRLCQYLSEKENKFYQRQRQNYPRLLRKCRICPMGELEHRTSLKLTQSISQLKICEMEIENLQLLVEPT